MDHRLQKLLRNQLMHEPKYSLKTYNGKSALGKLRQEFLEEEVLPLSVRRTQKLQQLKERRTSFGEFDF
jgi:hypothetical protein